MVRALKRAIRWLLLFWLVFFAGIWALNSYKSQNMWWFLPWQPHIAPSRIVVWQDGHKREFTPDDPQFEPLATGVNLSVRRFYSRQLQDAGIAEEEMEFYYSRGKVIEAYFDEPIRFNLPVQMDGVTQLLFPLAGPYSQENYLFIGKRGIWFVGALRVKSVDNLKDVVEQLD